MSMQTRGVVVALLVCVALKAAADGAGGMHLGYTAGTYPAVQQLGLPASGPELVSFGGYGYGVTRRGSMSGGFGMAFLDAAGSNGAAGGVGGVITGLRILRVPIHLALVSWTGVGGLYTGSFGPTPERGFFVGMEEVDLEIGLPFSSWFMPTFYAGYRVIGNLMPGLPFRASLSYVPVAGVRIGWGSFR